MRILFVCHGNICRSPMAEYVMKDLVRRKHLETRFEIASAATSHEEFGSPVYPPARRKLAENGIACAGHRARQMTRTDYDDYDLIVCMDQRNIRNALQITDGDPEHKIVLLLDYAGRPGEEVADPWYTGDFDTTWDDVVSGCEGISTVPDLNTYSPPAFVLSGTKYSISTTGFSFRCDARMLGRPVAGVPC